MLDITKPIRRKGTKQPAEIIRDNLPGELPFAVAFKPAGYDYYSSHTCDRERLEEWYENVPEPIEVWVNRFEDDMSYGYATREDADAYAQSDRTHLLHITITGDEAQCEVVREAKA